MESKPKDRDFVETVEGYLFCVVGYLHPSDGYTAYLKYVPSEDGKWMRNGVRYSRSIPYYQVSQVENTYQYLKDKHPEYILQCPVRNIEVSWVPKNRVKKYYNPQERMRDIKTDPKDPLEEKLLRLTRIIEETTSCEDALGVTGSILTKTHNPAFSDIDLTVYGKEESYRVMKALKDLKKESKEIKGISSQEKGEWIIHRISKYKLTAEDLMKIAERRWNYGCFEGTYFSIHPTRKDEEITENYGDNIYHRIDEATGKATVSDASESIYLPAVYKVSDNETSDISEVVSFEGLYGSLFDKGDTVEYSGILEELTGKNSHKRLIVGGAGSPESYIKWV
jgi:predicted nucleotidyltransferase